MVGVFASGGNFSSLIVVGAGNPNSNSSSIQNATRARFRNSDFRIQKHSQSKTSFHFDPENILLLWNISVQARERNLVCQSFNDCNPSRKLMIAYNCSLFWNFSHHHHHWPTTYCWFPSKRSPFVRRAPVLTNNRTTRESRKSRGEHILVVDTQRETALWIPSSTQHTKRSHL